MLWLWSGKSDTGRSAPESAGRRTVVIGTARTVRQVRRLLRQVRPPVRPLGCLLLHATHHSGAVGMSVLGTADQLDLVVAAHRVERVLVCLPAAMSRAAAALEARCRELDLAVQRLATLEDQLAGRLNGAGPIDPADLLGRKPHRLDHQAIRRQLAGKRVLITGAGGSIGSHLARLVAAYQPAQLLLMERSENNLFEIDRRLKTDFPLLESVALLHDVTDESGTLGLAECYRPQVVFHAAAHKHVPMMEDHPRAAVENNFFGTKAIADAAHAVGAEQFVMISTDKAVRPASVMGATKRLAELYVQDLDSRSTTRFAMVRFGNVLGSACSVLPIWADQIARGGPVTVTDPRMTRYFMTIAEAAALVLQAACLPAESAGVFVLDMGRPVGILDLARRFIQAHGLEVGRDIDIAITGIRPGEKLHEQLAYDTEQMKPTAHPAVRTVATTRPDPAHMQQVVQALSALRRHGDRRAILQALTDALDPTDQPTLSLPDPAPLGRTA